MSSATGATEAAAGGRLAWRLGRVAERRPETARAVTLGLEVPGWPGHRAGQHVDLRLTAEDGYQAQRSYSIASPPGSPLVELTVERLDDGEVSPFLADDLAEGDELELRGPIGGYFVWEAADPAPLWLIGGGSGLVPLMAMLRHRRDSGADAPARLLLSARAREDVLYREELEALGAVPAAPRVDVTLTRERPPGWTGLDRRVDAAMLAATGFAPSDRPTTYVCGPTAFVEAVATDLVALGHDPARVRTERFGVTGGTR